MSKQQTIFRNATVFDGSGAEPSVMDVAVEGGQVVAIGERLPAENATELDCSGQWLMPGLLDIHTHLDLEVELAPELPEVLRHGTTTVLMSNCSLGVAFGNQRKDGADPIVDCFARVENIPKSVLSKVADVCHWNDSGDYLDHFDGMNLGPNVVPLIPHSMLRIEVMGLQDSVSRDPTPDELNRMEALMEKGMGEGYVGFSTDNLPFHFLANQPNARKQIPTQFASYSELKRLTSVLRKWGRVWQATPPKDSKYTTLRNFLLTSGRLHGKPLKTTATAAIDVHTDKSITKMGFILSALLNSWLLKGLFRFQCLSSPFKVWSDGVITPLAEEIPELRLLNEKDLDDRAGRLAILNDPTWVRDFRKMWFEGKSGFSFASFRRLIRREHNILNRRLDDMFIESCPVASWQGEAMEAPYQRLLAWQNSQGKTGAQTDEEAQFFASLSSPVKDDADFFLCLLREWDTDLRWHTTVANRDPAVLKKLLFHKQTLPGFNDSGAHLTNMAFYDGNLRTLKMAKEDGLQQVAKAVHRLTALPAEFLGLNAGVLKVGAQADITVINPDLLTNWNPEDTIEYIHRDLFEAKQLVNRPEGIVTQVMVAGKLAWSEGDFMPEVGEEQFGRLLRAKDHPAEIKRGVEQHTPELAAVV